MVFSHSQSDWLSTLWAPIVDCQCMLCAIVLGARFSNTTHHTLFIWWTIFSRSSYVEWIDSKRHRFCALSFCGYSFVPSFYIRFRSATLVSYYSLSYLFFFLIFCSSRSVFWISFSCLLDSEKTDVKFVAFILHSVFGPNKEKFNWIVSTELIINY